MTRKLAFAAVGAVALGAIVWRCRTNDERSASLASRTRSVASRPRHDPAALEHGSIAGVVMTDGNRPVPGARVCARGVSRTLGSVPFREPVCATADAHGAYTIGDLLPARYAVTAVARPYRPGLYAHDGGVEVAEGARVTGISILVRGEGVELTGVVADVTAGPVAHARVTAIPEVGAPSSPATDLAAVTAEVDEQGRFSMWVAPGAQYLTATADGYADGHASTNAPGRATIALVPEGVVEGTVIDAATEAPIADARVVITPFDGRDDASHVVATDARGAFRFDRLRFDRFTIVARAEDRYGQSAGSLLVGLGQHHDGVVIRAYPAHRVAGNIVVAPSGTRCRDPYGSLRDDANDRTIMLERDGDTLVADGVPPATYIPYVACTGFATRTTHEPITVADRDIGGLAWEVTTGTTVRGKVVTRGGTPIAGAWIYSERIDRASAAATRSRDDGSYELAGIGTGATTIKVRTDQAIVQRSNELALTDDTPRTVIHDFVLDDAGTVDGVTVDADGKPAPFAPIVVDATDRTLHVSRDARSNGAGVFTLRGLPPGDYRVAAAEPSTDTTPQPISVRAGEVTRVTVTAAARHGSITGRVIDAHGQSIGDALVVAVSEDRVAGDARRMVRWIFDERPVLTAADGTFAISGLVAAPHVVRAYRRGGGDAIAERVAVGSSVTLQLPDTANLTGTVNVRGGSLQDLVVSVADTSPGGMVRTERFYGSRGTYAIADLAAGNYSLQWDAEQGTKTVEVTLAAGESKTVDVELDPLVGVTGRVIDLRSRTPLPAIKVVAYSTKTAPPSYAGTATTDAAGRFRLPRVAPGTIELRLQGMPSYPRASAERTIDQVTGTIELGDLPMIEARATGDDPVGELGFELDESRATLARHERKVATVDSRGPAARSGLRAGDVIVRADGVDLTGAGYDHWDAIVTAPPGTKLVLELARGATITIVLAAPAE